MVNDSEKITGLDLMKITALITAILTIPPASFAYFVSKIQEHILNLTPKQIEEIQKESKLLEKDLPELKKYDLPEIVVAAQLLKTTPYKLLYNLITNKSIKAKNKILKTHIEDIKRKLNNISEETKTKIKKRAIKLELERLHNTKTKLILKSHKKDKNKKQILRRR